MSEFIYRMQNKNGEGCYMAREYRPSDEVEEVLSWHCFSNGRPCPQEDIGIERNIQYGLEICGFESARQAVKWFRSWERRELKKEGFQIVKVQVKKITARGTKQCLAVPYKIIPQYRPTQFSNDAFDMSMP